MINRRVLRIKTMQSIYAYRVLRQAIYELAKEFLKEGFEPDYMAEVPEDRKQLKKEENLALATFNEWLKDSEYNYSDKPEKVAQRVTETIKYYRDQLNKDKERLLKKMVLEIEDIFDMYLKLLLLGIKIQELAADYDEKNLTGNRVFKQLKANKELSREVNNRGISWDEFTADLRKFFKNQLKKDTEYESYDSISRPTFEEDKNIALFIYREMIFEDEVLDSHFSEIDMYWSENKSILKGMVKKTIKDITEGSSEDDKLLDLSNNWEDDKAYIKHLFECTLENEKESIELIGEKSRNWEVDRLALTDKIILNMGISEMINFPSIPVKVSINEFIEISKLYSTPQSKQFVNGMLDSISSDLLKSGRIKKSGRGLIDNKI